MNNNSFKKRVFVFLTITLSLGVLGQALQSHCSDRPTQVEINSAINIHNLYPWPDAKIPFACQTLAYLKSPFAPRRISEDVFKEDGFQILGGHRRDGVIVARIAITGELYRQFPELIKLGSMPPFAEAVSLYMDGNELQIGHIGYRGIDREFIFTTILNPFLWPGKHMGKIVILLPSGETLEYEWQFEITWW